MSQSVLSTTHPVLRCAAEIGCALDSVAEVSATFMTTETKRVALLALSREAHRLRALMLRVMAASDDVAAESGVAGGVAGPRDPARRRRGTAARAVSGRVGPV